MNTPARLLVVMDPIDHIKYQKDTTLALLLAAHARGYELHYAEMQDLRLRDGVWRGAEYPGLSRLPWLSGRAARDE